MTARTRIKCSACGKRIPRSEPDAVLQRDGSTRRRYYHQRPGCIDAAKRLVANTPDLWFLELRHIDPEAN